MRLRFYKHDVDFVDLSSVGMGMKFITVSFSKIILYSRLWFDI